MCALRGQEVPEMRVEGRLTAEGPHRPPASSCPLGAGSPLRDVGQGLWHPGRHQPAFPLGTHVLPWCPPDAQDGRDKPGVQWQLHRKHTSSHGCGTLCPSLHSSACLQMSQVPLSQEETRLHSASPVRPPLTAQPRSHSFMLQHRTSTAAQTFGLA